MRRYLFCALTALLPVTTPQATGQMVEILEHYSGINADIPDGNRSGLTDTRTITTSAQGPIVDVKVTLTLSGTGFGAVNGDFYAYLQHDSGFAILMNRPGRRDGSALGYDDNGLTSVTFDDSAANGDIHNYRLTLGGNHDDPITSSSGALTGTWAPDGRNILPESSGTQFDSASRDATLGAFNGLNPNGQWTLFIADLQTGGTAKLESWDLQITAIPELGEIAVVASLLLGAFAVLHSRRKTGDRRQA